MLDIECPNGHKLRVPPDYVGHPGTCTQCRRRFIIGGDPLEEVPEPEIKVTPAPRFPSPRKPSRRTLMPSADLLTMLGIMGGVVTLLVVIVATIALIPRGRPTQESPPVLVTKQGQYPVIYPNNPQAEPQRFFESQRRLAEIATAINRYQRENNTVLHPVMPGSPGYSPYSWRVAILPYLGLNSIHKDYHFKEPWDSPHNLSLVARCPEIFRSPFAPANSTNSGYFLLNGPGAFFEFTGAPPSGISSSEALMIVEAKRDVPWTKPDEILIDRREPCRLFGGFVPNRFTLATFDRAAFVGTISPDRKSAVYSIQNGSPITLKLYGDPVPPPTPTPPQQQVLSKPNVITRYPQPPGPRPPASSTTQQAQRIAEENRRRAIELEEWRKAEQTRIEEERRLMEVRKQQSLAEAARQREVQEQLQRKALRLNDLPFSRRASEIALKKVVRALIRYNSVHGRFPPAVVRNSDTKTLYSWRVEILPYLDHADLYRKYRKDLPWDSPENLALLQSIPPVFRDPASPSDTNTHCLAITGPGTFFQNEQGSTFQEVESKGLLNLPALVAASTQIPWTKPDDLVVGNAWKLHTPEVDDGQIQIVSPDGTVANVDRSAFIAGDAKKLVNSSCTATLNWIGNYQGRKGLDYIGKLEILPNVEYLASELQQKAFRDLSHRLPYQYQSLIERSSGMSYASLILLQSAMNQYLRDHGRYPSPVTQDTPEAPLRSWRVELLPYLGYPELYGKYNKNEPWDGPQNAKLLDEMPIVFNNQNTPSSETPYTVIVGPGTIFHGTVGKSLEEIKDGIASTIFIVETGRKVPWTKPEDLEFDQNGSPPFLASVINKYVRFTTGDLNVHSVNNLIPPDVLKKMALCADDPDGTFQKLEVSILTLSLGDAYLKMGATAPLVSTTASQSNPDPNDKTSLPVATNQAADPEIKNLPKTPDVPQVKELSADDHQKETVRLTDALKDAILALEEGDITRFYESYAPLAELEEMKNRGILKSEKVPFLPRESQQWLTTLKGFQGIVPQVAPDGKSALIPLASGEKSDAEEQQAPPRQRQIEPNSGPGFGDRIHVVLANAIATLETKDYSAFVEKIYPAGELLRLELDGQKQPLIDRLKNKPELVQQMLNDLKDCQGTIPQYNSDRSVVTFEVEVFDSMDLQTLRSRVYWQYGPPPSKSFKFQLSGGSWKFYDHTLEQMREIDRQSTLDPPFDMDNSPRLRFSKINEKWRLESPSRE